MKVVKTMACNAMSSSSAPWSTSSAHPTTPMSSDIVLAKVMKDSRTMMPTVFLAVSGRTRAFGVSEKFWVMAQSSRLAAW
jgi:hypothetical protein